MKFNQPAEVYCKNGFFFILFNENGWDLNGNLLHKFTLAGNHSVEIVMHRRLARIVCQLPFTSFSDCFCALKINKLRKSGFLKTVNRIRYIG